MPWPTSSRACSGLTPGADRCAAAGAAALHHQLVDDQIERARLARRARGTCASCSSAATPDHLLSRGMVVLADDLLWSTRIAEAVAAGRRHGRHARKRRGAGYRSWRPHELADEATLAAAIVDLAGRRFDAGGRHRTPARVAPAGHGRASQHDDQLTRRRALAAGARPGLLLPEVLHRPALGSSRAGWTPPRCTGRRREHDHRSGAFCGAPGPGPGSRGRAGQRHARGRRSRARVAGRLPAVVTSAQLLVVPAHWAAHLRRPAWRRRRRQAPG